MDIYWIQSICEMALLFAEHEKVLPNKKCHFAYYYLTKSTRESKWKNSCRNHLEKIMEL